MSMQIRGGIPQVWRSTIAAMPGGYAAEGHMLPAVSSYLEIVNTGSNPLQVFFTAADFTANANYLVIAAGATRAGPYETGRLWLGGQGGATSVELVAWMRRG